MQRMTLEQYLELPESTSITELINGELIVTPPLFDIHQVVLMNLMFLFAGRFPSWRWCPLRTGLHFDNQNFYEPDLFGMSPRNQSCQLINNHYWSGAPDLVIEILSPSTASYDRGIKFDTYEKYGVREYWSIEPHGRYIDVYRLMGGMFKILNTTGAGQNFFSTVLGGVIVDTKAIFEGD